MTRKTALLWDGKYVDKNKEGKVVEFILFLVAWCVKLGDGSKAVDACICFKLFYSISTVGGFFCNLKMGSCNVSS